MKKWMYDHIYIHLVDARDRNHGKNGFTLQGWFYQFLVYVYSKLIL